MLRLEVFLSLLPTEKGLDGVFGKRMSAPSMALALWVAGPQAALGPGNVLLVGNEN